MTGSAEHRPLHVHLVRDRALEIEWADGVRTSIPLATLRRHSPSADARALRDALAANPLTVLPHSTGSGPLTAIRCEPVGSYALRIEFSDGHRTGLYTWPLLRELGDTDPGPPAP